jgi:putative transposase
MCQCTEDVEIVLIPPQSPNFNAYSERWIQSCKTEVLDYFISFSEGHLWQLVPEYIGYYNEHRPHQGLNNVPLSVASSKVMPFPNATGEIACKTRLGGLLRHYYRKAV